jgi:hypothetical protein
LVGLGAVKDGDSRLSKDEDGSESQAKIGSIKASKKLAYDDDDSDWE